MPAAREPSLADPPSKRSAVSLGEISRGHAVLLLALLTIAGAWLRLSHLGSKSLWLDEGATVALARASWQHFAWVWWHGEANLQTIYFLLMRGWIHLGLSEAWLRLPSALFGIASIPLIFVVGRRFMATAPALAAAALLTFSPTHVHYSQEARSYTLTILLVLLSTYVFVQAVDGGRRRDWGLWTLFGILGVLQPRLCRAGAGGASLLVVLRPKTAPWRPVMHLRHGDFAGGAARADLHFPRLSGKPALHVDAATDTERALASGHVLWRKRRKIFVALILWIAGLIAILHARRRDASVEEFWQAMLIVLVGRRARRDHGAGFAAASHVPAALHDFFAACDHPAGGAGNASCCSKMACRAATGHRPVRDVDTRPSSRTTSKPREDWRAASNAILSSAHPETPWSSFPFYTRIMLDYYRDRYSGNVFRGPCFRACRYYAGGEDVRTLLQALNPRIRSNSAMCGWWCMARTQMPASFDFGA